MSPNNNTQLKNPVKIDDLHQQFATPGVYVLYCEPTDRYYIGQSKWVIKRIMDHFNDLDNRKHVNTGLQTDYIRFGKSAFVADLLYEMQNASPLALRNKETQAIQRFKIRNHKLYNEHMATGPIHTHPTVSVVQATVNKARKANKSKSTNYNYDSGDRKVERKEEHVDYNHKASCNDCGKVGVYTVHIYDCDDGVVRCSTCIEKHLDKWVFDLSTSPITTTDINRKGWALRWYTSKKKTIKQHLHAALKRYIEKHGGIPNRIYASGTYNGPEKFEGVNVEIRKQTPNDHIDLIIPFDDTSGSMVV